MWSCRDCGTSNPEAGGFCGGCGAPAQALRAEELRLVTALFADISGFTTLADTLDTESLHEVITPLIGGLTRIAERYGGFIEKFAGDALLVVYGAPVTHEDDAQRALLTALDMHAGLPRLLGPLGPAAAHLTIHIGVNTGRVIGRQAGSKQQSDYAVLGDSVILAQRLESVCPPGETYVGATTQALCKQEFAFESVGQLTLKGKLKPVEGFRLLGRQQDAHETVRPLVGRGAEVAALVAALDTAAAGQGVACVVSGEPGAGKSRLIREVQAHARATGMRWLPARCLSYGSSLPYWPFTDLLRQHIGIAADAAPPAVEAALGQHLPPGSLPGARRLLGLVDDAADPQRARREVHDAVTGWMTALAADAPAVLCVEDLHWGDRASRELLGELLRTTRDLPVAVLLTTRPEGAADVEPLLADVDVRRLDIAPLDRAAVPEMVRSLLGGPAGPALVELLSTRTGGNPLFVEELTCSLRESGALVETSAGWDVRPGWDMSAVPETVERVFATRLDALPASAAGLLQIASVVGRTVRFSLLLAVAGAEADLQPLDSLVEAGLLDRVVDSGERAITFHHALLHDVVYGRLLRKRRRELHRRVAEVALALYGDGDDSVGLLARHLYLAEAGAQAVDALLRAGRRAASLYANDEAALHLQRAVEVLRGLPEAGGELPTALLELAELEEIRGEYDEAYRLFEEVRGLTGEVRAWRGLAAVLRKRGQYEEALAVLDVAAVDDPELVLERAYTLEVLGRPGPAADVVLAALQGTVSAPVRARFLLRLASAQELLEDLQSAAAAAQEAIDLVQALEDTRLAAAAHRQAGAIHFRAGLHREAATSLALAQRLAEQTGLVEEAAGIMLTLGMLHMDMGQSLEAVCQTQKAVGIFERLGHGSGRAVGYGNLADFCAQGGQLEEAEIWADRALAHAQRIGHAGTLADASLTLAKVRSTQQRWEGAATLARLAAERFTALGAPEQVAACDEVLHRALVEADREVR